MSRPWRDRPVTVMGLGLFGGGSATVRWLIERGARVTVTDMRDEVALADSLRELEGLPVRYVLGRHEEKDFTGVDAIVANPAVPPSSPFLEFASRRGVYVTSELELCLEELPSAPLLVTGTHGKSSTVHFTMQLLEAAGIPAVAGGNIGTPLLERARDLEGVQPVIEVSSYQLEALERKVPRARGGLITPVVADHLERHGTVDAYKEVKASLASHIAADGFLVAEPALIGEREDLRRIEAPTSIPGRGLEWDAEQVQLDGDAVASLTGLTLPGDFQGENVARAACLAHLCGAGRRELEEGIARLRGLPHRLEDLGQRAGRRVIDNGVSTTPESTLAAVQALDLGTGDVLLVGGRAKRDLDYTGLAREAARRGLDTIAFGADGEVVARHFEEVEVHEEFEEAVRAALTRTPRGATLLLSPACASFDAFPNFRARAHAFRALLPER